MEDCSSSSPTAVLEHCEATLELGRKLTKELDLDQSVDTLGRWMAHYIAELIQDAENACAEERPARMQYCCDAILKIWKHRHTLSFGNRPFEELEPLLRTLESLDPDNDTPRYYRSVRAATDDAEETNEIESWLEIVNGLDYSAKTLIRYFLTQAAQTTLNKSAEWVALAEAAGAEESAENLLVRMLSAEDRMLKASEPSDRERERIEDRIKRLEAFAGMAMELVSELRQESQQAQDGVDES